MLDEQVSAGGYSSASEYVREMVRTDQKRKAKEHLENILLESLQSGDAVDITPQMWEELRRKIRNRAKTRKR